MLLMKRVGRSNSVPVKPRRPSRPPVRRSEARASRLRAGWITQNAHERLVGRICRREHRMHERVSLAADQHASSLPSNRPARGTGRERLPQIYGIV